MTDTQPQLLDLDGALLGLSEVVSRLATKGRSLPKSAAVKAALQVHGELGFDEKALGFRTFREFLTTAEKRGVVQIISPDGGSDVEVQVPGATPSPPDAQAIKSIREDVWVAFTRWDKGYVAVWDRREARAWRLRSDAPLDEREDHAGIRAALKDDPGRFVSIEPVKPQTLLSWANAFAATQRPDERDQLLEILEKAEQPVQAFTQRVRQLGLHPKWHLDHVANIRALVLQWAQEHAIEINLRRTPKTRLSRKVEVAANDDDDSALRQAIHAYISKMTRPELLSLTIPARLIESLPK